MSERCSEYQLYHRPLALEETRQEIRKTGEWAGNDCRRELDSTSVFITARFPSFLSSLFIVTPLVVSLASFTFSSSLSPVVQAELCDSAAVAESSRRERQRQTQEGGADAEGHELPG